MDVDKYFKAVVDASNTQIVICDLNHTIIYMNPKAINDYSKHGNLVGKSILDCHNEKSNEMIKRVVEWFKKDVNNNVVHTFYNVKQNKDVYMYALREDGNLIGYYEKHEFRNVDNTPLYELK